MTTGYVYRMAPGFWGILAYLDRPTVFCKIFREDVRSVYDACDRLGRFFAGNFVPADTDQIAWANVVFKRHFAELLPTTGEEFRM